MKKNLIFKLCFIVGIFLIILSACSLGTQSYGKLSLSIEIPEYLKTEPNEQPSNARFIHPNGNILEFELYTKSRVIHTQSIALKSGRESPQKVSISVDKVPYNVPLFAEITVYGEVAPESGTPPPILGYSKIDIGEIRYSDDKLSLGVKPEGGKTVEYEDHDPDGIILSEDFETPADTFKIKTFHKKGLYTFSVDNYADISLYDSDGKNYKNSCFIDNLCVFYHPEDKASIYYAYLSEETDCLSGYKLDQDILITRDGDYGDEIIGSGEPITINSEVSRFTIYNPYPFTLNLKCTIDNADGENVNPDGTEKFTFPDFPDVLLPGKSEEFTVNFHNPDNDTYSVKSTISANGGLKGFVLLFTGSASGI